ncbi:hypothetical protein SMGD1_2006 [Sulfurimonas gotlandica GD1]|uniref:Uncharacterized protein n=1 Tax=Sulfurimonas gotlandica (strain DSM 19862 / JCM 16533 / GD1) TaxID=929558 RepID=B6BJ14_SULGG|nr:hypothetical protein [Sulfurimonas gotlandica]EDZ63008.1 hypothetical protein CBGD1_626 [Sulfurimonas gotlandica GD1]EHP30529.1 hypothetical protein SMGD1_2006 [Sulfurimonas gotlandica GD1]
MNIDIDGDNINLEESQEDLQRMKNLYYNNDIDADKIDLDKYSEDLYKFYFFLTKRHYPDEIFQVEGISESELREITEESIKNNKKDIYYAFKVIKTLQNAARILEEEAYTPEMRNYFAVTYRYLYECFSFDSANEIDEKEYELFKYNFKEFNDSHEGIYF